MPSKGDDIAALLTPSSAVTRAPNIVSTSVLDGELVIEGTLGPDSEQMAYAVDAGTTCSPISTTNPTDVHAIELVGPGPHQLVIDGCDGDPPIMSIFQSSDGSANAVDADDPCLHRLTAGNDWCGIEGYRIVASGLVEGVVYLELFAFLLGSDEEHYRLRVSSSTSCTGSHGSVEPGPDPAATPFADPNPMSCTNDDLRRCAAGTNDPTGGDVTWEDCCLTDLPQNPDGKCGLRGNGSACFERQQPGNLDPACPDNRIYYSFPPNTLAGNGTGCCNWRTGLCGLMSLSDALNLGCSPLGSNGDPSETPCTPNYEEGIIF